MKVLFATTNPAKIKKYADKLKEKDIEVLTIKDLGINLKPEEKGKNAIENAYIKAKAYYEISNMPTFAIDEGLYLTDPSATFNLTALLDDRNKAWSYKIEDYLLQGGTTFIFAGCAHFTGSASVFGISSIFGSSFFGFSGIRSSVSKDSGS